MLASKKLCRKGRLEETMIAAQIGMLGVVFLLRIVSLCLFISITVKFKKIDLSDAW